MVIDGAAPAIVPEHSATRTKCLERVMCPTEIDHDMFKAMRKAYTRLEILVQYCTSS